MMRNHFGTDVIKNGSVLSAYVAARRSTQKVILRNKLVLP